MSEKINYKFKIGDTVQCIKDFIRVKVGDISLIEDIHSCGDNDYLVLNLRMKDNVSGNLIKVGIPSSHFEIYIGEIKMKKYRIKEEYIVTQWTYVTANSPEEALDELCEHGGD